MMTIDRNKKRVALVGPISCNGGIAAVVNAVASSESIMSRYELLFFNTTNYKDSNFFINFIIFIKSIVSYLKKMLEGKVDLAHIHTSYERSFYRKIFFIFISSFFKVKIILHLHSSKFDDFFIDSGGLKKKIIEFFLKKSHAIVLLCKDWKEKIDKRYSLINTVVINNPTPLDIRQIKINTEESNSNFIKILFLGFLIKTKGIYDLIEIADRLNKSSFAHKIIICGKGEEERKFLKKIKDRNLSNIEYLGWVLGKRKLDLLKNSDIFLLPSYKEGMPMVILEALTFGLPIISTKIAGLPDMVIDGENGYLLNPGDIDGFVEKIKILILHPGLRKDFGSRSRIIVQKFAREKIAEDWNKLYQKVQYGN